MQVDEEGSEDAIATKPRRERLCGRACGHFTEVVVSAAGHISCNCEECQKNGWCVLCLLFGLVEHGTVPSMQNRDANGISWDSIRTGWTSKLKVTVFSGQEEEEHAK